jgi:hypothetical protein
MPSDPILALADALETLPLAVRQGLVGVVQTFGEFLLDYNRSYLRKGLKPDGTPIDAGGYSPAYAAYRAKYGKQTTVKDLNFTGEYYEAFLLPYLGGLRFEVENTDSKAAKLLASYGELYGIREEDIEDFVQAHLVPEVAQIIHAHMQLAL